MIGVKPSKCSKSLAITFSNLALLILLFALTMFILYVAYKKVKAFRTAVQEISMKIPVFKNVIIYNEITIFAKTFASLLRNNVYITDSMGILSKITNNEIYKAIMYKTIDNIYFIGVHRAVDLCAAPGSWS